MPSSHLYQINELVELIVLCDPDSLLDIGVGFGKYGYLSREYLELWDGREKYGNWKRRIDGIEAFPEYLTPVHSFVYDNIYKGDALKVIPKLNKKYDLIILVDVLEHFTKKEGTQLIKDCKKISKNILISTPHDIGDQEDSFDNPYETHKHEWKEVEIRDLFPNMSSIFIPNQHSLIAFFGSGVDKITSFQSQARKQRRENKYPFIGYPRRIHAKVVKKIVKK